MERAAEDLLEQALSLPDDDRPAIVGALLESLELEGEREVEAWREEVAAGIAALDAGEVESVPWAQVRDRLFARLRGWSLGAGRGMQEQRGGER